MSWLQKPLQSGNYLLEQLNTGRLDAKQLTIHQRRICVAHLLYERTCTSYEIAKRLKIHPVTVRRYIQKIKKENLWMLDSVDARSMVLDLIQTAEVVQARLFNLERYKDAWNVLRELVEILLSLGYLKPKQSSVEENLTIQEMLKLVSESEYRSQDDNVINYDGKTPNP